MESYVGVKNEVIKAALSASKAARGNPEKRPFVVSEIDSIVAFRGSWSPEDWFRGDGKAKPFGDESIDHEKFPKFPSLRNIGRDDKASVNKAFMERFQGCLDNGLRDKVDEAWSGDKQIVFTGHSSGGAIAIYATVWFLEERKRSNKEGTLQPPLCLTFGSPLATDRIFGHAIRREGWSDYFVHFVMKLDIVPRILFAPRSSTEKLLKEIDLFSDPHRNPASDDNLTSSFVTVMKNASCAANYAACELTGSKHTLFDTMSRFIKTSPYLPCGKYVFCTGTGRLVVVENPDAVLQLLFYSLQIESERELENRAKESLKAHWQYDDELKQSLARGNAVSLKDLRDLPLSSDNTTDIGAALNDLNLYASARLCLRAAGELEKKKQDNKRKLEGKKDEITKALEALKKYRKASEEDGVGYYDAFKFQRKEDDFKANVKRLELAAIWDEIIEMLRNKQLPDEFEADKKWVDLGTQFRRLVEPLDIANYYRHSRTDDAGHYLKIGNRPSRYRFPQKWLEHAEKSEQPPEYVESSFWAKVEDLKIKNKPWNEMKEEVREMGKCLKAWHENGMVEGDAFSKESTLVKWWQPLYRDHQKELCDVLPLPLIPLVE
ncbi:hypothetical protein BT93_K0320 [Corymbia citriodora subsp. variegata]|nr:hypothetical protein BT93_K0320 [Corymbia citriodora subsp. variegata]